MSTVSLRADTFGDRIQTSDISLVGFWGPGVALVACSPDLRSQQVRAIDLADLAITSRPAIAQN